MAPCLVDCSRRQQVITEHRSALASIDRAVARLGRRRIELMKVRVVPGPFTGRHRPRVPRACARACMGREWER